MTPARSLAASVIALGFASSFTAPPPAFAAPAPCGRTENYAAQAGAEMLRIDRLDPHSANDPKQPTIKSSDGPPRESARAESSTDDLLGPTSALTSGDPGDSGQGVTGFLDGTSDLLKSITDGGVKTPAAPLSAVGSSNSGPPGTSGSGGGGSGGRASSGGQGGGGAVRDADASIGGVGLGETKAALVTPAQTNSAAAARMVDGKIDGKDSLTTPLAQDAPPSAGHRVSRSTPASTVGPLALGSGDLGARAQWDPAMACGNVVGEAARSDASLGRVDLLRGAHGALVRVPEMISSRSRTALERRGSEPRTVASATVTAGRLTLAGGKIKIRILRAPVLTASMATGSGGEVQYRPAIIEVSGPGIKTKRLAYAGNSVNISLDHDSKATESTSLSGLSSADGLSPGPALPLPSVPGLPSLDTPDREGAPAAAAGTQVRISLGQVRQASRAHAIAAKATAIKIAVSVGSEGDAYSAAPDKSDAQGHQGYGSHGGTTVEAEFGFGVLEAAALAPKAPVSSGVSGLGVSGSGVSGSGVSGSGGAGSGGALPITGPQAGFIIAGGAGLLIAGGAAVFLTRRRRRTIL